MAFQLSRIRRPLSIRFWPSRPGRGSSVVGRQRIGGVTEPTDRPAVAVAIITGLPGVLIGRRRDGTPPWTFPGGKIEPGESPEGAAVREVLEETGLRVRETGVIGQRMHPRTGVPITYVAAMHVDGADAVAAGEELDEVRWVRLPEAGEMMADLAAPVRYYLDGGALGAGGPLGRAD